MRPTFIVILALCFSTACGDDDDGPTPVEQCDAFIDTLCDKEVECGAYDTHADCVDFQQSGFDCGDAVEIGNNYDSCLDDIEEQTCAQWTSTPDLPASCTDIIIVDNGT